MDTCGRCQFHTPDGEHPSSGRPPYQTSPLLSNTRSDSSRNGQLFYGHLSAPRSAH
ncbi:hypothetical protein PTT_10284 [Pyrenophora teres f. teres 0-1]|uniref:Uncharacterized protein n=1 Tax=Pyrenophora teres f. teres (strain 0-1) TaxID=861557 RepID=E3RNW5_PYRTT|nr:hypothetical protein PTT_10284 [Pyrenophora teres f. teres 0-1]